jgi:hypothetical protein
MRIYDSIKNIRFLAVLLVISIYAETGNLFAQDPNEKHALLISGLGGSKEYDEKFHKYLYETRKSLLERFQFSEESIIVLAGSRSETENFVDDISTAENIKAQFLSLSNKTTEGNNDVYIFLFGHGSFDGKNAVLNIPRRDLKDSDYAGLVAILNVRRIVFINTASSSAPFITALSGPNRMVITATKSGRERNETIFPKFLVEALNSEASDRDKNGDISVLELFQYASEMTERWYEDANHLATEHPLLEDTGDRLAYRAAELQDYGEGGLASTTYLLKRSDSLARAAASAGDSLTVNLIHEKEEIEEKIAILKSQKSNYSEPDYFALLQPLFVRLAAINAELEKFAETKIPDN